MLRNHLGNRVSYQVGKYIVKPWAGGRRLAEGRPIGDCNRKLPEEQLILQYEMLQRTDLCLISIEDFRELNALCKLL